MSESIIPSGVLKQLSISHFILIDSATIEFGEGLTAFTGETGAGKSMVVEALRWLFAGRNVSDEALGRKAVVSAVFVGEDGRSLAIKRDAATKAGFFVNGEKVSREVLMDLASRLIDFTNQDDQQGLLKSATQREFLDRFSPAIEAARGSYREAWAAYQQLVNEKGALEKRMAELRRDEDYVTYQLTQLKSLSLDPQEEENLLARKASLKSMAEWQALGRELDSLLGESRSPFMSELAKLNAKLSSLTGEEGKLKEAADLLHQGRLSLREGYEGLSRHIASLDAEEVDLDQIEAKLSTLKQLRRKYNLDLEALALQRDKWAADMAWLRGAEGEISALERTLAVARKKLIDCGQALSKLRADAAHGFKVRVVEELRELGMGKVAFDVELKTASSEAVATWGESGADEIQFLFSANQGRALKPLSKTASGGERSRTLLAIKAAFVKANPSDSKPLYIFDEIDTGVGGEIADLVGQSIKRVSSHTQVMCITHLAQIAQYADAHFAIGKESEGAGTVSVIRRLEDKEREVEVARMLGGGALSEKTHDLARDILSRATLSPSLSPSLS